MPKGLFTNYVDNFFGFFEHQRPSFIVSILLNFFSFIFFEEREDNKKTFRN